MPRKQKTKDFFINSGSSCYTEPFISLLCGVALIPNLALPDEPEYQIGKYGRMRRSYLKEHRPVLYASLLTSGTLHRHLAEIDQACNERMAIIVSDMARQEDVTEALKAADQMEWVRRMNSIRSRAEEIVLTELVYN